MDIMDLLEILFGFAGTLAGSLFVGIILADWYFLIKYRVKPSTGELLVQIVVFILAGAISWFGILKFLPGNAVVFVIFTPIVVMAFVPVKPPKKDPEMGEEDPAKEDG